MRDIVLTRLVQFVLERLFGFGQYYIRQGTRV